MRRLKSMLIYLFTWIVCSWGKSQDRGIGKCSFPWYIPPGSYVTLHHGTYTLSGVRNSKHSVRKWHCDIKTSIRNEFTLIIKNTINVSKILMGKGHCNANNLISNGNTNGNFHCKMCYISLLHFLQKQIILGNKIPKLLIDKWRDRDSTPHSADCEATTLPLRYPAFPLTYLSWYPDVYGIHYIWKWQLTQQAGYNIFRWFLVGRDRFVVWRL